MTLWLVGLGPSPELHDLTRRAERCLRDAERVLLDTLTAGAAARRQQALEALLGRPVEPVGALDAVERDRLLASARDREIALAVPGDPLVATPYAHLLGGPGAAVVVPGLSAWTSLASQRGLDPARCRCCAVAEPGRPSARELERLRTARVEGPVVVLAVGRHAEVPREDWVALQRQLGGGAELVEIDGGGWSLLLS